MNEANRPQPAGSRVSDSSFILHPSSLSIAQSATLACLWEVMAPKAGNVHRGADFAGLTLADFAASAVAIGPALQAAAEGERLGRVVLAAIEATRAVTRTNTNLGIVLLLAPLAKAPRDVPLVQGVRRVLDELDAEDSRLVYEAIRLAQPGGMGSAAKHDIAGPAPPDLLVAMRLAAERDMVARQYVEGFADVLGTIVPWLGEALSRGWRLCDVIVHTHLRIMARWPDSLIARKCGLAAAQQAADWAVEVLASGNPGDETYYQSFANLDFWLRSDHNRRNPGTSADLITAALFAALRDGVIELPMMW
jgi:triphosphoribosyl-dephospho-CoA synthase